MTDRTKTIITWTGFTLGFLILFWVLTLFEGEMLPSLMIYLAIGGLAMVVLIFYVLPWFAGRASNMAYDSNASTDDDPRWKAIALRNRGEYEQAIEVFLKVDGEDPKDRFALTEVYTIRRDKLEDVEAARETLELGIERDWPSTEDSGFFYMELCKLAREYYEDEDYEVSCLEAMAEALPETRYSAKAMERLREIRGGGGEGGAERVQPERPTVPKPR